MSKENPLIDELSKMSPMVIKTAYLHAINYTLYGEDVTEKWLTATQNASALEKAYKKGYDDALRKQSESKSKEPELKPCPFCGTSVKMLKIPIHEYSGCYNFEVKCPHCGCSVDYIDSDTIYRSEEEAIANVTKAWNERYTHWFKRAKKSEE